MEIYIQGINFATIQNMNYTTNTPEYILIQNTERDTRAHRRSELKAALQRDSIPYVVKSKLLLQSQNHPYYHNGPCFPSRAECRMGGYKYFCSGCKKGLGGMMSQCVRCGWSSVQ